MKLMSKKVGSFVKETNMKSIILLSGGIDSSACLNFYHNIGYEIECLFCDYGQPAAIPELQAANAISKHYRVPLYTIRTTNINIPKSGEICGRNALLVLQAFCFKGFGTYKIILGTHSGTKYVDCTQHFINEMNRVLDCYSNGTVYLEAPFIKWGKGEIAEYCKVQEIAYKMTYSCETGNVPPCGKCLSCLDRKAFFNE